MTSKPPKGIINNHSSIMKRTILFFTMAVWALMSCSKETRLAQENVDKQTCALTVSIHQDRQPGTRADEVYSKELGYETAINSLQLLIFDNDSLLRHYCTVEKSDDGYKKTVSVTTGKKRVWAVANCSDLSGIKTEKELMGFVVKLEDNSVDATKGFVMAGCQPVEIKGSAASATVSMSRMVGRIALCSITNSLPKAYGAITVNRVFISNVVGNQNLQGDAKPTLWYNKEGRMDESPMNPEHIIDGSTCKASCESLTFKEVNSSLATGGTYKPEDSCVFYGMPNSATDTPTGFMSPFTPQNTVLVVVTTINSKTYYYPVAIKSGIARNCSYSVYLSIIDLGSDDPNKPLQKESLSVTVEVNKWDTSAPAIIESI